MNLKSIILTLAIAFLGVSVSFETASAGSKRDQMSGRVKDFVGCGLQPKIVRAMKKHPERWGKPPASLASLKTQ
jgi:hypothetical protein